MYLTREDIDCFNEIIVELNKFDNRTARIEFLKEHVEDVDSFLSGLKNVDKAVKNFTVNKKGKTGQQVRETSYNMEDIASVFHKLDNGQILETYKLKELQDMYYGIYGRLPISSYNKARIVSVIRNRIYSCDRIEGFNQIAKERK